MYKFIQYFRKLYRSLKQRFGHDPKPFVYIAIGDSAVEGIGASTQSRSVPGIIYSTILSARKEAVYHNLGKDGATVHDVVEKQLHQAISYDPDLITISVGANDVRHRTGIKRFHDELSIVLSELKKETHAEIVINTIPDLSLTPRVPGYAKAISNVMVRHLNTEIESLAARYAVICIDMYRHSRIYAKSHPEVFSQDGFHPSDFGYAIWANTIISHITHILFPQEKSSGTQRAPLH